MSLLDIEWLMILLPIVAFAIIAVVQYFFYNAYIFWTVKKVVLLYACGISACFGFAFWAGSALWNDPTALGEIAIFAGAYAIFTLLLASIPAIFIVQKCNNYAAYFFIIVSTDVLHVVTLLLAIGRLLGGENIVAPAIAGAVAILIGIIGVVFAMLKLFPNNAMSTKTDFEINDTLPRVSGKKVKVILITGQSNASGVCRTPYLKKKMPKEFPIYEKGFDNVWINYFNDNGARASNGFVHARINQGGTNDTFGPELGLSEVLSKHFGQEPVFIVKYAWGGSNLNTDWLPPTSAKAENRQVGSMYSAFIKFTKESLEYMKSCGYEPEILANCWMQGEGDSSKIECHKYKVRTLNLVRDTIKDLQAFIPKSGMTFVDAGISDSKLPNGSYIWKEYVAVNDYKKQACKELGNAIFLDTVAEGLSCATEPTGEFNDPHEDFAHYDSKDGIKLGHMFGDAVVSVLNADK